MKITVVYSIDGTTHTDYYTGKDASRQTSESGLTNIIFRGGEPGILHERAGDLAVRTATYQMAWRVLTCED